MDFLEEEMIVTKIILAMFMPKHKGDPIHRNRPSHGLVYYVDCAAVYSFESGETLTCHSGEYSVTDVAILSGFNDAAYFAREFKKKIGVSPTEYRKRK